MSEKVLHEITVEEMIEQNKTYLDFIEDRYKEMEKRCQKINDSRENIEIKSYNEGFAVGYKEGIVTGELSMQEKANKICEYWNNDDTAILSKLFDGWTWTQIFENIETAYNKIVEYEKKKEEEEKEIKVGDEVKDEYGEKYIVRKIDSRGIYLLRHNGEGVLDTGSNMSKTGKHYPIEEMLKELEQ